MPYKDPKCEAAIASRKRATDKYKNSEKCKTSKKQWALDNPEKIKESVAKYRLANKEKIKKTTAIYRLNNKNIIAISNKKYDATEQGKKMNLIKSWRKRGIIGDLHALYDIYLDTLICDNCQVWLNTNKKTIRCHDHCHDCGLSKGIVCFVCNTKDKLKCKLCN